MSSTLTSLRVVQFNVRGEATKTMQPMFASKEVDNVDIIAIQEPPYSKLTRSSTNPGDGFHLAFEGDETTRTCFYVNKRIDVDSWDVTYHGGNLCTLKIVREGVTDGGLSIHNVYNPPPGKDRQGPSTVPLLEGVLTGPGEHILLGDFNLHHRMWNEKRRVTSHAEAEELLIVTAKTGLRLLTP